MKRQAFTLVELMVAVGLMGMMIAFTSVIFRFGIDAHRISSAKAEIMQKVRVITEQLNSDLRGLRKDAPVLVWFQEDPNGGKTRYDQIMFFADGDFSSYQLYEDLLSNSEPIPVDHNNQTNSRVIKGNLARIQYALARGYDKAADTDKSQPFYFRLKADQNLGRRSHILSADTSLDSWPDGNDVGTSIEETTLSGELKNEIYEHDSVSISRWKALDNTDFGALGGRIINTCFDYPPLFDSRDPTTFHKLLCEQISWFEIQWAYWDKNTVGDDEWELRWFPDRDPDSDGDDDDSHFRLMQTKYPTYITQRKFGAVFNVGGNHQMNMWMPPDMLYYSEQGGPDKAFGAGFYPAAFKFTFTVHDSKGIIQGGRKFTHIVYLEN